GGRHSDLVTCSAWASSAAARAKGRNPLSCEGSGRSLLYATLRTGFSSAPSNQDPIAMLRGLRKASSSALGKGIMGGVVGFLVLAFAIWGIGDIFRGYGRSTFAKVGNTEISIEQFRVLYNDRL